MRRLKYRLRPRGLIVACGLWGVLGCSTPDTVGLSLPPTKPDSNIANLPVHHDSAVVDMSGAVIAAGDAEVVIPQGALAEPVEIVVQTVQAAAAAGLQTFPEAENETILQFLPHGTQFLKPVTIQVPHHYEGSEDLVLYTSEPNELWAPVAGATFTDEFAKADVMHFSFFFTSPKRPPASALVPEARDPRPDTNNGGAGGAPSVDEAKGGSGGTPGAAGAGEPIVDPGNGQAGTAGTDTGNDPDPIVAPDAGLKEPPPDTGAGGAGNSGADAGVAGGGGATDHDPGAGGGSAGSPDAGTSTGGAGNDPPPMQLDYLANGEWYGHLYSLADDTSFVDRSGMCASGIVSANPQSQSFALWGWNLNEAQQGPVLSWEPTLEMMHYEVMSSTPVRLSLRDADGKDWCYALPDGQGDVSFLDFNSACWDNSGDFYNGTTPLVSLNVVVPGDDNSDVPFDLCVKDLFPENEPFTGDPGGGGTAGATGTGGAGNGGPDAGVPGGGGAPDHDPGAGGGSAGSPDAGSGTGGLGTGGAGHEPPPVMDPDYRENGDWRGDMFTIVDPTSSVERVGQCAMGTVTSNPQFQSFGGWGWNLNQQLESLPLSWDPTLPMVHYDVDSTVPLRLSLRDSDGKDWCYVLPEARGDVAFTEFNSACWDNSGEFYNGTTPLVSIGTVVPGDNTTNVDFQLCVNELYPESDAAPPPPPPPPPMQLDYRNIGDWQGHLYSVADNASSVERSGMCGSGLVAANAQSYALWGWNLNQQPDDAALAWDPTLQSIHYFIGSSSPLRLSLRDEQGRDWCYPIDTTTGDVLLSQFNSACWDFSGDAYDGTPLISINVVVPGNDIAPVDFNFCVSDLFPQDPDSIGGGAGGAAGAGGAGSGGAGSGGAGGASTGGYGGAGAPPPPHP